MSQASIAHFVDESDEYDPIDNADEAGSVIQLDDLREYDVGNIDCS